MQLWSPIPMDTSAKHSHTEGSGKIIKQGVERLEEPPCSESVSFINVTNYYYKISPTWSAKCELNKDYTKDYTKLNIEKPTWSQSYKNSKQLGKPVSSSCHFTREEHNNWFPSELYLRVHGPWIWRRVGRIDRNVWKVEGKGKNIIEL